MGTLKTRFVREFSEISDDLGKNLEGFVSKLGVLMKISEGSVKDAVPYRLVYKQGRYEVIAPIPEGNREHKTGLHTRSDIKNLTGLWAYLVLILVKRAFIPAGAERKPTCRIPIESRFD